MIAVSDCMGFGNGTCSDVSPSPPLSLSSYSLPPPPPPNADELVAFGFGGRTTGRRRKRRQAMAAAAAGSSSSCQPAPSICSSLVGWMAGWLVCLFAVSQVVCTASPQPTIQPANNSFCAVSMPPKRSATEPTNQPTTHRPLHSIPHSRFIIILEAPLFFLRRAKKRRLIAIATHQNYPASKL